MTTNQQPPQNPSLKALYAIHKESAALREEVAALRATLDRHKPQNIANQIFIGLSLTSLIWFFAIAALQIMFSQV